VLDYRKIVLLPPGLAASPSYDLIVAKRLPEPWKQRKHVPARIGISVADKNTEPIPVGHIDGLQNSMKVKATQFCARSKPTRSSYVRISPDWT